MELTTNTSLLLAAKSEWDDQQAYDLVDLATVKSELDIDTTEKDALFFRWITQASAAAANFCDRVFPVEIVQDQIFPPRDYFPAPTVMGGVRPLQLSRWPLVARPSTAGTPPPLAPVLSSVTLGALGAATYYAKITYVTPTGETAASLESSLAVAANNLPQVAAPIADTQALATGWNCYLGSTSFGETLQNATPIPIGTAFTLPTSGLTTGGAALPTAVLVLENEIPLAEGVDFIMKGVRTTGDVGQLIRLDINGYPKKWPALPILVQFSAGYVLDDPKLADAVDAVIRMIKGRYFAQLRDPALRSENIVGAYEAQYWLASGPGAAVGNLTPDVAALLEKYRVPVLG
jgi:hypothetical protein